MTDQACTNPHAIAPHRYVVIGAGAVGATTAAALHEAGREVVLVARGRHLDALRERGLDFVRPDGVHRVAVPVTGGPAEVELRESDVLVLVTKSQDTEAAIQQWAWQPVGDTGAPAAQVLPIVLMQNGLDNSRTALRRFATVFDAVVLIPASYLTPGEVVAHAAPDIGAVFLGRAPQGTDRRVEPIAADLRAAGFAVQTVSDIARWKAGKLLTNVAYNLDALYRPSALRDAASAELSAEARAVLTAAGIEIADPHRDGPLDRSRAIVQPIDGHEHAGSSTWQSLARDGSPEADFLNGEVVLLARLAGLDAPRNRAVQHRVARAVRDGTEAGTLTDRDLAETMPGVRLPSAAVLVDVAALRAQLAGSTPPVLLDVRWALGDPDGRAHYEGGHIPAAVFVDLESELAGPPGPSSGRHPLPGIDALQQAARRWGISTNRSVVVYDDTGGMAAARAWWLLRWAGLVDVRILDGAFGAWVAAGLDVEGGTSTPVPGDVELSAGHLPTLTADDASRLASDGVLLDARASERYRGEVEPVDPRAGHIPGAISAPTGDNLDADGSFRSAVELAGRFAGLGVDATRPVGAYCGSGITASHEIAAMAVAGIDAALYPGSWSAWSSDPTRPVATGAM